MTEENLSSDPRLIHATQEYLRSQIQQKIPDTVLTVAWDEFYGVYDALIRRFVIAQGMRAADVDDCVQEVWVEVVTRLADFQHHPGRSGLRAWLYTIVRSKVTDLIRRKLRRPAESLEDAREGGLEPATTDNDPAILLDRQWEKALLETILDEMRGTISIRNYRLLCMRLQEGREVSEVAAELELSPKQVWYRQHRLVKKVRARLSLYTGEPLGGTNGINTGLS